ncbi:hypothetical protein, partial [Pseudarthrobacter oxydans]|uniref:hypothetical protein n=1 Tax=Pseudarthrobacter oxydans TaxID=1671 RepID=UPI001C2D8D71
SNIPETIHFHEFFVSYFFAAMFQSYFIHFHFANPVVFPEFTRWNESAHHKVKHFFVLRFRTW